MSKEDKSYNNISDEELMKLSSNGENDAFAELYERYSKKLYFFFLRMLFNDEERSKDFVQNVFLKIIENTDSFNTSKKFSTWVFTIASNLCKNEFRHQEIKRNKESEINLDYENDSAESIINNIDKEVFNQQLFIEIDKMDAEHKAVFMLKYQQNMSLAEISEIVGCPIGTVKSRLFYTLKKISEKLKEYNPNIEHYG